MASCVTFQSSLAQLVLHTSHSDGILLLVLLSFQAKLSLSFYAPLQPFLRKTYSSESILVFQNIFWFSAMVCIRKIDKEITPTSQSFWHMSH